MMLNKSWQNVASYVWIASSNVNNTVTFYLDAKVGDYNINTNKTPIYTKLRSVVRYSGNGGTNYKYTCSYAPTVQGSDVWNFVTETITETNSSINNLVEHNADGTKSLTLTATLYNGYKGLNKTISGSVTLPTIPRASSVAVSNGNIGSNVSINISRASSSFTHTLTYNFKGLTGTIATKTSSTSFNWTLPTSFYSKIPNNTSGDGTIYCDTYSGNTKIGSKSDTFTAYVSESSSRPTIEGQPKLETTDDASQTLTGNKLTIIKDYSNLFTNITAMAHNSATLYEYRVIVGEQEKTSRFTNNFNKVNTNIVKVYCKDSRKYSLEGQFPYIIDTLDILNYYKPKITNISIARTEQTSTEVKANVSGNYWNKTFGAVTNIGSIKYSYRIKESSSSTWGDWSSWVAPTISGSDFSISNLSLGTSFDTQKSYDIQFRFKDALSDIDGTQQVMANTQNVTMSTPIFEVYDDRFNVNGSLTVNDQPVSGGGGDTLPINSIVDYTGDEVPDGWENVGGVIWEGTLKGGETITLPEYKRFLEIYARILDRQLLKYTIDTSYNRYYVSFGSGIGVCNDAEGGLDYYISECVLHYNGQLEHKRTGFFNIPNGTYTSRLNNENYVVYRIETHD